ncbi:MAG: hypothetical protein H7281_19820 [Bacteriovorax sp.]|nr:hypothetical protein [Bacteriovorax sp.]
MDIRINSKYPINKDLQKSLNSTEINQDLDFLIYSLDRGYSGSLKLPQQEYKILRQEINSLRNLKTVEQLGNSLAKSFVKVSDNHLGVYFKKLDNTGINFKESFIERPQKNLIGPNLAGDEIWKVDSKSVDHQRISLIGITQFPNPNSELWNGFEEAIRKTLKPNDTIILDLRGNIGGDDSKGGWLANYLDGSQVELPYADPFDMNTKESFKVMANAVTIFKKNDQELEHSELDWINKLNGFAERAENGEKVDIRKEHAIETTEKELKTELLNYKYQHKGNIYILMDRRCGSSGESTIDFFENIPRVKKIGQNTAGYVHFGNNGFVMLPHSSIIVQLATSFNTYKDGRFIEKIGIKPDIFIESGKDALDVLLKNISN